ncbi:hypothetical protein Fleli_1531 [Bernardetia litoralis DSM 6794]|uniref:Uncharacterized protein n=1 Tax=Bernardetia litoralis (strain ATCC 23117 / DSM 6794 / NBRC 15988 / NCIMB 1366 / Fx l1 / Sio-4) TaxID=880071 RepID=I4AJ17_BERLS|nr:hypothetical protein [Bernardetia litoralis]AFM03952.1 hypothetical protein Fleli_1531 [Bernardetia litoralis DSM 6794]
MKDFINDFTPSHQNEKKPYIPNYDSPYTSTYSKEAIYELDTMRPMSNIFIGKLVMGLTFAYSMIWMPLFFKILLCFVAVSILIPLVKEYWTKQIKSIRLTNKYLEIRRGANNDSVRVDLRDIKKIELIERQKHRRYRRRRGEVATILFERPNMQTQDFHPETKCVVTDTRGNRIEIEYRFFLEGDFEEFLGVLEDTYSRIYNKHITTKDNDKKIVPISFQEANKAKEIPNKQQNKQHYNENIARLDDLIAKNNSMLENGIILNDKLENSLEEVYKSIYYVRSAFDIAKMPTAVIIYEFKNANNLTNYILENDFYKELDEENIEMGLQLIETAIKNIRVAQMRNNSFKKINKRLRHIKFQKERRLQLQGIMHRLNDLQEENTNQDMERSTNPIQSEEDIDLHLLDELEDLSYQVDSADDLQKAMSLNEHISLFDDENKKVGK